MKALTRTLKNKNLQDLRTQILFLNFEQWHFEQKNPQGFRCKSTSTCELPGVHRFRRASVNCLSNFFRRTFEKKNMWIHAKWYIYLHESLIFMITVGKYTIFHGSNPITVETNEVFRKDRKLSNCFSYRSSSVVIPGSKVWVFIGGLHQCQLLHSTGSTGKYIKSPNGMREFLLNRGKSS